ncbi:MAG: bifunctional phosphoserine phosphatase/homoserine phosphotransferase ThrH [Spirochaetaceae bacterium]|jgi:phosphoserine/homoserine phosphotransferase|nr:bifunctional phosphoserine phosphatase/homoserine phosphotransferase ThrH [Spirochaetaceae bacterium]
MRLVCLDLEGVLVPEIWIAFSQATGISAFRRTTRDEPDYDALMRFRIGLLEQHGLGLRDLTRVIALIEPLAGALQFTRSLRARTQLIILSDTYEEFAAPLMAKLDYPTIFCNSLVATSEGKITGYKLRQQDGKRAAVAALKSLNIAVFAAGDSFNDLAMIREADRGCLFRAPEAIREAQQDLPCVDTYTDLLTEIEDFLNTRRVF